MILFLSLITTQINTKNYGKFIYTFLHNVSKNIYIHSFKYFTVN